MIACMSHGAFEVTDLEGSVSHATEVLGMRELAREGGTVFLTHGPPSPSLELRAGPVTTLDHFALLTRGEEAMEQLIARLDAAGVAYDGAPTDPGIEAGVRVTTPAGHLVDICLPAIADAPPWALQGQPPYIPSGVRPRRVGHINLSAEDLEGTADFFVEVLGFRTSDLVIGTDGELRMVFLRCDSLHHDVGISRGPDGMAHYAFEVDTAQDLVRLGDLLDLVGRRFRSGPGRHSAGDNIATYHQEPSQLLIEVYAEMQRIDDDRWEARRWPITDPRLGSIWGALPELSPLPPTPLAVAGGVAHA